FSRRALSLSAWLHPTAPRAAISSPMVIGPGVRHDCPFASGAVTSAVHNLFRAVISCGVSLIGTNPAPTERPPAHEVRGGGRPLLFGSCSDAIVPHQRPPFRARTLLSSLLSERAGWRRLIPEIYGYVREMSPVTR